MVASEHSDMLLRLGAPPSDWCEAKHLCTRTGGAQSPQSTMSAVRAAGRPASCPGQPADAWPTTDPVDKVCSSTCVWDIRALITGEAHFTLQHRSLAPPVTELQSMVVIVTRRPASPPRVVVPCQGLGRPHLTLQGLEAGCSALLPVLLLQHCIEAGGGCSIVQIEANSSDHVEVPTPEGGMAQNARHLLAQAVQVIGPLDANV